MPVPVAAGSKAWVYGRSPAAICVRIPPGEWIFVVCIVGTGLCDKLITRPEKSHRLWHVVVCDQETSWYEEAIAQAGLQSQRKK
jgi:hypothetical protein